MGADVDKQVIGKILSLKGVVTVRSDDGELRHLTPDSKIYLHDKVESQAHSSAVIHLHNGKMYHIDQNSIQLFDLSFTKKPPSEKQDDEEIEDDAKKSFRGR